QPCTGPRQGLLDGNDRRAVKPPPIYPLVSRVYHANQTPSRSLPSRRSITDQQINRSAGAEILRCPSRARELRKAGREPARSGSQPAWGSYSARPHRGWDVSTPHPPWLRYRRATERGRIQAEAGEAARPQGVHRGRIIRPRDQEQELQIINSRRPQGGSNR